VQLISLNIHPDHRNGDIGRELLNFLRFIWAIDPRINSIVGVTRCGRFHKQDESYETYLAKTGASGLPVDPIVAFHVSNGAQIVKILPNYRPEDIRNCGNGVLIRYSCEDAGTALLSRAKEGGASAGKPALDLNRSASVVQSSMDAVRSGTSEATDFWETTFTALGFDSMDLLDLQVLLAEYGATNIDPTVFFRYPTPTTLAQFIMSDNSSVDGDQNHINGEHVSSRGASSSGAAIVGIACEFPGAADVNAYWDLLFNGRDGVTSMPPRRSPGHSSYGGPAGYLHDVDMFDDEFFGVSHREACAMDPQQRKLLQLTWKALENANIVPADLRGRRVGVFVGAFAHDYEWLTMQESEQDSTISPYFSTGNASSVLAGRISYIFDFQGPSMTVHTACSSSAVCVHLARSSLQRLECDIAIVAGVNLLLTEDLSNVFSAAGMLAPDGRCKTFSSGANGYVRSEGCGVLVLKREEDAISVGDAITAVVCGSAINQDGHSNGLTAPNASAQVNVIREALQSAGRQPSDVRYLEAHGTGTSLGDAVEFSALRDVFSPTRNGGMPLLVGSVKTNIGHSEAAAGIASVIKVALAVSHGTIPAHLHCGDLNRLLGADTIPAIIPQHATAWDPDFSECNLVAGVSSFGFSGTNAHLVVAPARPIVATTEREPTTHLLCISAKSMSSLFRQSQDWKYFLQNRSYPSLSSACFTAASARSLFGVRLHAVGSTPGEMIDAISRAEQSLLKPAPGRQIVLRIAPLAKLIGLNPRMFCAQLPLLEATVKECDEVAAELPADAIVKSVVSLLFAIVRCLERCASPFAAVECDEATSWVIRGALGQCPLRQALEMSFSPLSSELRLLRYPSMLSYTGEVKEFLMVNLGPGAVSESALYIDSPPSLLSVVGQLFSLGYSVLPSAACQPGAKCSIPGYAFEPRLCWQPSSYAHMTFVPPAWIKLAAQHDIGGDTIVPGACHILSMATAASAHWGSTGCTLINLKLPNACIAEEGSPILDCLLRANGQLSICTKAAASPEYASGQFLGGCGFTMPSMDFASLCCDLPLAEQVGTFYARMAALGMRYGTDFQLISKAWKLGTTSIIAKLDPSKNQANHLHPCSLDAALQSVFLIPDGMPCALAFRSPSERSQLVRGRQQERLGRIAR